MQPPGLSSPPLDQGPGSYAAPDQQRASLVLLSSFCLSFHLQVIFDVDFLMLLSLPFCDPRSWVRFRIRANPDLGPYVFFPS